VIGYNPIIADVYCHPGFEDFTRKHLAEHVGCFELHSDPALSSNQIRMTLRSSGYSRTWTIEEAT